MSDDNIHPNAQNFDLPPNDVAFIAENLAEIAEYLGHLDGIWDDDGDDDLEFDIPNLSSDSAEMLRTKVFANIHRNDVAASALRLGTEGIMEVLIALVRPAMSVGSNRSKKKKQE
ncbi:MAG: hypothetical protein ACPG8W_09845 [Candidatus Promineifilaceae bacterium]